MPCLHIMTCITLVPRIYGSNDEWQLFREHFGQPARLKGKVFLRLCTGVGGLLVQLFFVERREEAQLLAVLVHELNILLAHLKVTVIRTIW